jgi:hypothetical protein
MSNLDWQFLGVAFASWTLRDLGEALLGAMISALTGNVWPLVLMAMLLAPPIWICHRAWTISVELKRLRALAYVRVR